MKQGHKPSSSLRHLSGHTGNQCILRYRRRRSCTSPPGYCLISHRHCLPISFPTISAEVFGSFLTFKYPETCTIPKILVGIDNRLFFLLPSSLPVLRPQTPLLPWHQSSAGQTLPPDFLSLLSSAVFSAPAETRFAMAFPANMMITTTTIAIAARMIYLS